MSGATLRNTNTRTYDCGSGDHGNVRRRVGNVNGENADNRTKSSNVNSGFAKQNSNGMDDSGSEETMYQTPKHKTKRNPLTYSAVLKGVGPPTNVPISPSKDVDQPNFGTFSHFGTFYGDVVMSQNGLRTVAIVTETPPNGPNVSQLPHWTDIIPIFMSNLGQNGPKSDLELNNYIQTIRDINSKMEVGCIPTFSTTPQNDPKSPFTTPKSVPNDSKCPKKSKTRFEIVSFGPLPSLLLGGILMGQNAEMSQNGESGATNAPFEDSLTPQNVTNDPKMSQICPRMRSMCPFRFAKGSLYAQHIAMVGPGDGHSGHPHQCKPCAFVWTKGCRNASCSFCHLWHPPKQKKSLAEQKNLILIAKPDAAKIAVLRKGMDQPVSTSTSY